MYVCMYIYIYIYIYIFVYTHITGERCSRPRETAAACRATNRLNRSNAREQSLAYRSLSSKAASKFKDPGFRIHFYRFPEGT